MGTNLVSATDVYGVISLLEADPDLGEKLAPAARLEARRTLRCRRLSVSKGDWDPPKFDHDVTGLLLTRGLMLRRVRLGEAASAEVVGPGDLIRPWQEQLIPSLARALVGWVVLEETQFALLDGQITVRVGRWPEVSLAISNRLLRRSRCLSYLMAAQNFTKVTGRLLATLWHLGSMWGRVSPRGIVLPFTLTHATLAELVSAERPSVSLALKLLEEEGRIVRDNRWILLGEAPDWTGSRRSGLAAGQQPISTEDD